jgi:hypothetical protein
MGIRWDCVDGGGGGSVVRETNMVMSPAGFVTENDCAGENRPTPGRKAFTEQQKLRLT